MANDEKKDKKKSFRPFAALRKWGREMRSELKKVVWPSAKQITNNTLVALVVMVVAAVVIFAFDSLASAAVDLLIRIGG